MGTRSSTNSVGSSLHSSQASSRKFARSSAYPTPRSSLHSFGSKHSSLPWNDILEHNEETEFASNVDLTLPPAAEEVYTGRGELSRVNVKTLGCATNERPSSKRENIAPTITSSPSEVVSKKYRCTTGEHLPKACSSKPAAFKRHELEHIERYHCIPRDSSLVYNTAHGRKCLLCGELDPDLEHFTLHHVEPCLKRDEPLTFTRQDLLAKHLKEKHAVPAHRTVSLTRGWCYQLKKTAFSCGICENMLFQSKYEQISHIQREHSNEGMEFWSETTMMRSLLQHPEVNPPWQRLLAQHPEVNEQFLIWPHSALENIRLELDLDSETAEDFAASAFHSSKLVFETANRHNGDTQHPRRLADTTKIDSPHFGAACSPTSHNDLSLSFVKDSFPSDILRESLGPQSSLEAPRIHNEEIITESLAATDAGLNLLLEQTLQDWNAGPKIDFDIGMDMMVSPVKRKVSAGKEKVDDTERGPWTSLDTQFELDLET